MKAMASCFLLFVFALFLELGIAVLGTIIASHTEKVGLGWLVLLGWLIIVAALTCFGGKQLHTVVKGLLLLLTFPVSLFLFEMVCLPLLRGSSLLK